MKKKCFNGELSDDVYYNSQNSLSRHRSSLIFYSGLRRDIKTYDEIIKLSLTIYLVM